MGWCYYLYPDTTRNKDNNIQLGKIALETNRMASEYARERQREYELERERLQFRTEELRVREFEVRESVRQRDESLRLQAQFLELMRGPIKTFVRYMEKKIID
ncbi:unnamed protein product [Chrysodeixis includens]|uniref:Uncharacterized protein n=1 Tax=Chrysodeixis includens TaxID=689277 RepID=A0A9N8Q0E0_CHRIL|nr:unnamed protein product [Chrysodeixis includens]